MEFREWMMKFGREVWFFGPTPSALEAYPYFYIDLLAAWEKERYAGARKIVCHCIRKMHHQGVITWRFDCHDDYYSLPAEIEVIRIDEEWEVNSTYKRRGIIGDIRINGVLHASSVEVHMHDGYGGNAGDVMVIAFE